MLVKADKNSTIGLQFDGEEPIYGAGKVLRTLIDRFPAQLGARSELVRDPSLFYVYYRLFFNTSVGGVLGQLHTHKAIPR